MGNGKYSAIELADKIVSIANDNDLTISNLHLQKVLYYVQGTFMRLYGKKAFNNKIECWPYGPVVREVWNYFNNYGRFPIYNIRSTLSITNDEYSLILNIRK